MKVNGAETSVSSKESINGAEVSTPSIGSGVGTSVPSNSIEKNGTKVPAPGYKQTKVGVIPEDWEETVLSSFIEEKIVYCNDEKVELGSLTIENGVIPKPIRYQREHLVKDTTDAYKLVPKFKSEMQPLRSR